MLLINMFLSTFPKQTYRSTALSFAVLFTAKSSDSETAVGIRLEKLKCIVNYFNIITEREYSDL